MISSTESHWLYKIQLLDLDDSKNVLSKAFGWKKFTFPYVHFCCLGERLHVICIYIMSILIIFKLNQ